MPRGASGREDPYGESAGSALLDAINRSKVHLARFILDANDEDTLTVVNTRDFKGKTSLIRAVYITEEKSRQRAMALLLQHGGDPNAQDDFGRTALSYACELRHNDVVRLLLKWNIDPDLPDSMGNTPLMYCAAVGNDTAVGILLKCFRRLGLAVDRENGEGFTALHIAAKNGFTECAARLAIEGHASVTQPDRKFGRTAEQWARAQGCATPEVALFSTAAQKLRRPRAHLRVRPGAYPSSRTSPARSRGGSQARIDARPARPPPKHTSTPAGARALPDMPAVPGASPRRGQFAARAHASGLRRSRTQPNVAGAEEAAEEGELNASFSSSLSLGEDDAAAAPGRVLHRQRAAPIGLQSRTASLAVSPGPGKARRAQQASISSVNTASRIDLEFENEPRD